MSAWLRATGLVALVWAAACLTTMLVQPGSQLACAVIGGALSGVGALLVAQPWVEQR